MTQRRILKFVVRPYIGTVQTADEPRFLAVGSQGTDVVVWAEATVGEGVINVLDGYMTGQDAPSEAEYIGTATTSDGIVVHVYRRNLR